MMSPLAFSRCSSFRALSSLAASCVLAVSAIAIVILG